MESLTRQVHPVSVVLFGSVARGEPLPDSDVDLLVLLPGESVHPTQGIAALKPLDQTGRIEVFPYGSKQFTEMLADYNVLALDAMADGVVLWIGDEARWSEVKAAARAAFENVEQTDYGWRVKHPPSASTPD